MSQEKKEILESLIPDQGSKSSRRQEIRAHERTYG